MQQLHQLAAWMLPPLPHPPPATGVAQPMRMHCTWGALERYLLMVYWKVMPAPTKALDTSFVMVISGLQGGQGGGGVG